MNFTCENCKSRHTWDCDDGRMTWKCKDFELDESTLSEEERGILRMLRQIINENKNTFKR